MTEHQGTHVVYQQHNGELAEELIEGLLEDAELHVGRFPHSIVMARPVDDGTVPPTLEEPSQLSQHAPVNDVVPPVPHPRPIEPEPAPPNPDLNRSESNVRPGAHLQDNDEEDPMPQSGWSEKRERQYEHIKEGLEEHGRPEDLAEEIAARTVNKERARNGEAAVASRTSTEDISSGRRGGLRSHRGPGGRTKAQLYEEARRRHIRGRSSMNKEELERAVNR